MTVEVSNFIQSGCIGNFMQMLLIKNKYFKHEGSRNLHSKYFEEGKSENSAKYYSTFSLE